VIGLGSTAFLDPSESFAAGLGRTPLCQHGLRQLLKLTVWGAKLGRSTRISVTASTSGNCTAAQA
jgi:hypothetical protein